METRLCRECGPLPADHFYRTSRLHLCKKCQNARRREHARNNPALARAVRRKIKLKRYGLTLEDYDRMVKKQKGRCAICRSQGNLDPASPFRLGVDHDHKTGRMRGLLCRACNRAVGILQDDWRAAQRMADYLKGKL